MKVEVYWCEAGGLLRCIALELRPSQLSQEENTPVVGCGREQGASEDRGGELPSLHKSATGLAFESIKVEQAIALLPTDLQSLVRKGVLHIACFGQHRSLDSQLQEGDRIELLGPVLLDVKAARSARVKAARARERGPYNRSYSGLTKAEPS